MAGTPADYANVSRLVHGQAMPPSDGGIGMDPVSIAVAAANIAAALQGIFGGKDKKATFKAYRDAAHQSMAAYGPDVVANSRALNLDPNQVAHALSEYLRIDHQVTIPAAQLLAASQTADPAGALGIHPMILYGAAGAGLLLLVLLMRR